jgi:N-acetylmuramoyl-L-alanine amidase
LAFFVSGCATVPREGRVPAQRQAYLKDLCERYDIPLQWDHVARVATLKINGEDVRVLAGSRIVLVGTQQVTLSAPVVTFRSSLKVPQDFKTKVIDRMETQLAKRPSAFFSKLRGVIIDAGHGGKDPGAIGTGGTQEKFIVLDIAKRLQRLLEQQNLNVIMTRTDDTFIELKDRTEIASRAAADLFVSVHANSSPARSVFGVEVFSLVDLNPMEKREAQRELNHQLMFKNMAMLKDPRDLDEILADMLYIHKQAAAKAFASRIAMTTAGATKTKNRGCKESRFFVLRNTLVPAVLVEVGFLSNPKEERLLTTSAYRQKVADGLAQSILDYANGR